MDLWTLGKNPVSSDQPAGADIRYEPEFEELQAELDKLSSPTAGSRVEWNKVVNLASAVLAQKSKDLLVASYLAVALIHTRQLEGLATGLRVFSDLLTEFWEDLYPSGTRMRGRLGAIDWWLEKSETALGELKPAPVPPEQVAQLTEDLGRIEQILEQHFDKPPSVGPMRKFIESIPTKPEEKPEAKAPPPGKRTDVREEPTGVAEEIASKRDAQRAVNLGLESIRRAAIFLRENDPPNPLAYRWTRLAAWSKVDSPPPVENGQTQLPPPAPEVRDTLEDLRAKGEWEALRSTAEGRLSQFIFWLDLNRFASEALTHLGEQYDVAHEVVCQETAFLVHRLPELPNLSFSDGTPFADAETRQWLKGIVLGAATAGPEGLPTAATAATARDADVMTEEIQKAQALAKKKKLVEAVEALQQHVRNSASERERLLWRLALSQLLASSKKPELALPHLGQVLQDIELYRLEEWDPELALRALKTVLVGFNTQQDQVSQNHAADVSKRIAKLNPAEALRLGKA